MRVQHPGVHERTDRGGSYWYFRYWDFLLAKPTRLKYLMHLDQRIVPQWGERRLCEINPDEVQQWLFETCDSWHMMNDLRGIMSGIYTKAEEWG